MAIITSSPQQQQQQHQQSSATLLFLPLSSSLTPSFWTTFAALKIDTLKLSSEPVPITGTYRAGRSVLDRVTNTKLAVDDGVRFEENAFDRDGSEASLLSSSEETDIVTRGEDARGIPLHGRLVNLNTVEAFRNADKQALFAQVAEELNNHILSSSSPPTVSSMTTCLALAFADLKKYTFYYWFAFPAFIAKPAWSITKGFVPLADKWNRKDIERIQQAHSQHRVQNGQTEAGACLLRTNDSLSYSFSRVNEWTTFFANLQSTEEPILLLIDPSTSPTSPSWILRNILYYLAVQHGVRRLRIVCLRATLDDSITATIELCSENAYNTSEETSDRMKSIPSSVGWERNKNGKLAPRMVDLGGLMDPNRLADQAVDLNLKLMRWRILPTLNLDKIAKTKCLLLGAGTLGCYVSRNLMAWGVRHITFVDSGRVSFSNPVRQPLFEFSDCLSGGKPKAQAAAEALKRIYPSIISSGVEIAIPMPGHPIPEAQVQMTKDAVRNLQDLMNDHDVVFLLMDSRESRWLPTLMGMEKGKLVINAALGFDSYVVARHGSLDTPMDSRLGCYYCSDIVAPTDSLSDRTLDQMCTVTRPGLAAIAGATAVELMSSILQHPDGLRAQASGNPKTSASVLGAVPHTIRGFLSDFNVLKITGQAYANCTACSDIMVNAYRKEGFQLLRKAFDDAKYLEKVTGLDRLQVDTDKALEAVEWDEEDDF